jgi:hypothetical protein
VLGTLAVMCVKNEVVPSGHRDPRKARTPV